jgi:hypothetical protein
MSSFTCTSRALRVQPEKGLRRAPASRPQRYTPRPVTARNSAAPDGDSCMAASDAAPLKPSPAHRKFSRRAHATLPAVAAVGSAGVGAYTSAPPPSAARTPT